LIDNLEMQKSTIVHKHLNGVDVAKFVLAIFVVSAHTNVLKSFGFLPNFILYNVFSRTVVPLFFAISGYFFYYKRGTQVIKFGKFSINEYYYKYTKRMLQIYMVWSLVYLFDIVNRYYLSGSISLVLFVPLYIYWGVVYGTYYQLWFFPALFFSITVIHLLAKRIGLRILLIIAFGFYIIGMFGDAYYGFVQDIPIISNFYKVIFYLFYTTRNGLTSALLFVVLGAMMSQREIRLKTWKAALYMMISIAFLAVEVFALRFFSKPIDYNVMLGIIPVSYFSFQLILGVDLKFKWNYRFLRDSSVIIFFSHPLFIILFDWFIPYLGSNFDAFKSVYRFVFVALMSFGFAVLVIKLKTHGKLGKLVSYLY